MAVCAMVLLTSECLRSSLAECVDCDDDDNLPTESSEKGGGGWWQSSVRV